MDEKKQGLVSRLFGRKHSGCCDVKIEEVVEETSEERGNQCCGGGGAAAAEQAAEAGDTVNGQARPCCGSAPSPKPRSRCCG